MLDVFTTIANGGVSRPPRLVAATIDAEGVRHENKAAKGRRVVSAQTAAEVNEMLRGVVAKGGTGEKAAISGYTVAGKTGTSRKPPYEPPRYMASFAGFAPAENPRLAALVVIDQPGTRNDSFYGGKVAAPLFASIMKYALRVEQIAPTGAVDSKASTPGPVFAPKPKPAPPVPPVVPPVPPSAPPAGLALPASTPPPGNVAAPVP
jgi:cell division protein FtsI (penicillin-binding protein 3)